MLGRGALGQDDPPFRTRTRYVLPPWPSTAALDGVGEDLAPGGHQQLLQRIRSSGVEGVTAVDDRTTDSGTSTANTSTDQGGDPDTCDP